MTQWTSELAERAAERIESLNRLVGRLAAWLYIPLIAAVVATVVLRYLFNITYAWLEEGQWYLYAVAFLLSFAYAYADDAHVRVDPFRDRMSARGRALVELLGVLFLLFPFCGLMAWHAWDYFAASWAIREGSPQFSGLPARWALKFLLFLAFVMLIAQGVAVLLRAACQLLGPRR